MNTVRTYLRGYRRLPTAASQERGPHFAREPVPEHCDRCALQYSDIRVQYKASNTYEFICTMCLSRDQVLRALPIKPRSQ